VLAHEIVTSQPYTFLDDEEFQNRRTNAVSLRRGLAIDLSTIGALEPDAIDRVHGEIHPEPTTADDLHDLLASLVVTAARVDWRPLWDELVARSRARVLERDGRELWCTAELHDDAQRAFDGDDDAVASVLRGHLEVVGVTTAGALGERTSLPAGRVAVGLAVLEHEGFALQGRYSGTTEDVEWISRRLLARMHSYSRRNRRDRVQSATAQDFMRFLLRWQHVAPGTQLDGSGGLATVLDQLQGYEAAAVAWEPELLSRRLRDYRPAWLDRLSYEGQVGWLRLTPRVREDVDGPVGSPSKATPITLVFRDDVGWLLEAARAGSDPAEPTRGATAEVLDVLRERGACFAAELAAATRRLPSDIERALWDGVSRGMVTSDGFGAIRAKVGGARNAGPRRMSRLLRGVHGAASAAGRWSLVPVTGSDIDRDELAEAVAELLLNRWGVLFRDLAIHDSMVFPWRDLQRALRRLEDRGLVKGGRFVSGFSGEQYALPAAAEQLSHVRKLPRSGERVVVNAADPLNLVGLVVPGATVPAIRTREVVYVDGVPDDGTAAGAAPEARTA
jgi:ATP-dependent Lhr-like helicase